MFCWGCSGFEGFFQVYVKRQRLRELRDLLSGFWPGFYLVASCWSFKRGGRVGVWLAPARSHSCCCASSCLQVIIGDLEMRQPSCLYASWTRKGWCPRSDFTGSWCLLPAQPAQPCIQLHYAVGVASVACMRVAGRAWGYSHARALLTCRIGAFSFVAPA